MTVEKVGSAISWNLFAKVARFVAMPIGYAVVVRSLGEYDWGVLNLLRTITAFVLVAVVAGGGNTVLRYMPQARVRGGMRSLMRDVRRLLLVQGSVWLALTAASWILSRPISHIYHQEGARFAFYLVIAVGFVAFEASMTMVMNILQSWYETRLLGIVIIAGNVAYVALLVVVLRLGWGIPGVFAAGGAVNLVSTLALLPQAVGLVRSYPEDGVPAPGLGALMRFSLPFIMIGLLNQIVWRHSEVLLLGHFTGIEASGYFGLAYRIPQMALEFIPLSIWPLVMAGASESYAKDPARLPGAIDVYYRLLFLLVLPVAALGFAFSGPLVPILFGAAMEPAARLTQLFFVVFSYSFIYTPLSMALYVVGKSWINMLVFAVLAVVNLGLDLALIPRFGLWGAFAPVAVTLLAGVGAFRIASAGAGTGIRIPATFIARCYVAVTPAALLSLSAARWQSPAALAVQGLAGVLLLWGGIRLMRIVGEREKELIRRLPLPAKDLIVSLL